MEPFCLTSSENGAKQRSISFHICALAVPPFHGIDPASLYVKRYPCLFAAIVLKGSAYLNARHIRFYRFNSILATRHAQSKNLSRPQ